MCCSPTCSAALHGAGFSGAPAREASVAFRDQQIHERLRMAFKVGYGCDSGRLFLRHSLVMLLGQSRVFYFDESRWTCPPSFFRRPSSVSDALQSNMLFSCLPACSLHRACRCHRRNDEYRDLVCFHPRLRRNLDHAGSQYLSWNADSGCR